ncbi:MAG TPA: tetratricopeptide repeat protein [Bacteroidota bacterium]
MLFFSLPLVAQTKKPEPDSPVFKSKARPPEAPRVPESDALDQIWAAFQTARKAQAGDKFAQHELALRYISGRGVERDTTKAAYWFEKAASQGLSASQFDLALLAYHGWGISWNPFLAYTLVRECAASGMPEGEFLLASFLTDGLMVPRDWTRAYEWARRAADAGYEPAVSALPEFAARSAAAQAPPSSASPPLPVVPLGIPDSAGTDPRALKDVFHGGVELRTALGISKMIDDTMSADVTSNIETVRRAARYGSPEALTVLGRCYEKGIEVRKDSVEAASMYVRAIRLDSPRAPALMLALLQQPSFVAALKSRTERNEPVAEFVTAGLAALGFESGVSEARAVQLLRKSADADYTPAVVEMGVWYYTGRWVGEDKSHARTLWYRAAAAGSLEASIRLAVTSLRDSTDPQSRAAQVGLLRGSADEGSLLAEMALGYCYEHSIGVPENKGEAAKYYRSAAGRGSQDAYRALFRMYDAVRPKEKEFRVDELQ